jgi:hypothetical protein
MGLWFLLWVMASRGLAGSPQSLQLMAAAEALQPIRPGVPGKAPFWNEQAKQFIWAPAFDFQPVARARSYRFTVTPAGDGTRSFEAKKPWAPLTPVWADVPVGTASLKVEALDRRGKVIGVAGAREFRRGAVFAGPYGQPVVSYEQSGRLALEGLMAEPFVQSWATTGRPAAEYGLYRYASKVLGALMTASALYAGQSPRPADADRALEIGRRVADFLLEISCPAGSPLEYFPPTYHAARPTERENDNWTMLISPAEAGEGYLNLHDATHDPKYLAAARRIADTYRKTQLPSGTWHLKVDNRTGKPIVENELIPAVVISFLDRLVEQYGAADYRPTLGRAVRWMMDNPVRTFDWSAQFDDGRQRKPYQNLSKHEACEFAGYLFRRAGKGAGKVAMGEELLRFAEDQFVVWERPPDLKSRSEALKPENWFLPCSTEQYAMFEPISGSSAFMIMAYVRAYQATHKPLQLAKAESLANALTVAQQYHHGRFPTRMVRQDQAYWINSTVNTIRALNLLAATRQGK